MTALFEVVAGYAVVTTLVAIIAMRETRKSDSYHTGIELDISDLAKRLTLVERKIGLRTDREVSFLDEGTEPK